MSYNGVSFPVSTENLDSNFCLLRILLRTVCTVLNGITFWSKLTKIQQTNKIKKHKSCNWQQKAPLLIGCDVRNMTEETMEILSNKEVIAVNQDPLGVQGRKVHVSGPNDCKQVWAGPLSGSRLVVALWNRCSTSAIITVGWRELGLQSSVSVTIRDLWQHKEVARQAVSSFGVQVESHEAAMYIFTPLTTAYTDM